MNYLNKIKSISQYKNKGNKRKSVDTERKTFDKVAKREQGFRFPSRNKKQSDNRHNFCWGEFE
ncbi:hypothetical protein NQ317_002646 [Molorchus minor]|uniref:Uncharacterized protein n=1 Tax=Molorchus minor TaxID=1323400 RepID=A0ABQ9JB63_9CUCU|nr:hypothetical protein NQ317_002646 [Molorchus minor]